MKWKIVLVISLGLLFLVALACGAEGTPTSSTDVPGTPQPTATPTSVPPTATPTSVSPTATPTSVPATPTPWPPREWDLEGVAAEGSTVTVELRVFAGIDVRVTLDGRQADETVGPGPTLKFIFRDVTPGDHGVRVSDVVGFVETTKVTVESGLEAGNPQWLADLIAEMEGLAPGSPQVSVTQYEYAEETVFFQTVPCCDMFSNLYDLQGNISGHPDGGIAGGGDGRVPNFFEVRTSGRLVWEDNRALPADRVLVPAPIESLVLNIAESFPLQYFLQVTSGLPNSCHSFAGYALTRDGRTLWIGVYNSIPSDKEIACAQVYGTVETTIPLGSDFDPQVTYTVDVNGETLRFMGDRVFQ